MHLPAQTSRLKLAAVALGLLAIHCLAPTQVTLEISTDAVCADLDEVQITVGQLGEFQGLPPAATTNACDEEGRIGSIVVVPQEKDSSFGVEIVVGVGQPTEACIASGFVGGCIVARRSMSFVRHTPLELPIELELSCVDVPCGALETCRQGQCVSAVIDDPLDCAIPGGCEGEGDGPSSGGAPGSGGMTSSGGEAPAAGGDGTGGDEPVGSGGDGTGGEEPVGVGGMGSGGTGSGGDATGGSGTGGDGSGGDASGGSGGDGSGGAQSLHTISVTTSQDVLDGDISSIDALLVDSGSDGEVSLREAILACNNTPNDGGPDTIRFAIPGPGPHVIVVTNSALPAVFKPTILDAATQPGYLGTPVIELDGSSPSLSQGTENGLHLAMGSDGSTVQGFAIHGFPQDGLLLEASDGHVIRNNYVGLRADGITYSRDLGRHGISVQNSGSNIIGGAFASTARQRNVVARATWQGIVLNGADCSDNIVSGNIVGLDATATAKARNLRNGIHVSNGASFNTIGGVASDFKNLVSGNGTSGIRITDIGTTGNIVQNNYIGSDEFFSASSSLGNGGAGIFIASNSTNNLIGGPDQLYANWIGFNGSDGVTVIGNQSTGNAILGNVILRDHGGNPIDLVNDGITPNDALDVDTGPNDLLNYPVLTASSFDTMTAEVTVDYTLDVPEGDYRVEFFTSPNIHASGQGALITMARAEFVYHPGGGSQSLQTTFSMDEAHYISATVTEDLGGGAYGSTSEVSIAVGTSSP